MIDVVPLMLSEVDMWEIGAAHDCLPGLACVENELEEHARWELRYSIVIHRLSDDTFWQGWYATPATEYQEGGRVEDTTPIKLRRLMPMEVTVTRYVPWKETS